jgi:hypothetical protein
VAVHTAGGDDRPGWRPGAFGLLLFGLADFAGAVGVGSLLLGDGGTAWLLGAAALLLAAISASG